MNSDSAFNYFENIQALDGYDISLKYVHKAQGVGLFNFASNIGVYNHYTHVDIPGEPRQETVGKSTVFNGTIPRWQSYSSIDFTLDAYSAFVGWRGTFLIVGLVAAIMPFAGALLPK